MIFSTQTHSVDKKYVSRQVIYFFIGVPVLIIFWLYVAIGIMGSIYFSVIAALILGFYTILYVSSQQKWLGKYNRIITRIDFNDDYLQLFTNKILWKKVKEITINNEEIRFKEKYMYWWAKKGKDKTTYVFNIEGKEYYLIAEYFAEIDIIIEKLENCNT